MPNPITSTSENLTNSDPSVYIEAYNLVLHCSNAHTPKDFVIAFTDSIRPLCPFDQSVAFFYDRSGKIADYCCVDTIKGWLESYLDYYIEMVGPPFNVLNAPIENPQSPTDWIINWDNASNSVFKKDYINTARLSYTWAFSFFDLEGLPRLMLCISRSKKQPYSKKEQAVIRLALPILANMHRNFYCKDTLTSDAEDVWTEYGLTNREKEIADKLCQGLKAARIGSLLYISDATVHKHTAHIYKKVNVNSQQELIARMLDKKIPS